VYPYDRSQENRYRPQSKACIQRKRRLAWRLSGTSEEVIDIVMRFLLIMLLLAASAACSATGQRAEEAFVFETNAGERIEAYRGSLRVPENRSDPNSRAIPIRYVRFPATTASAGPPVVYLAGGPGGSGIGTARGNRFSLFMAMREFGDVIALDQRGTGESNILPRCHSAQRFPRDERLSDARYKSIYRAAFRECLDFWQGEGVDVRGYTTLESVADLDALRVHLGADKLTLWGTSYGSHLALAAAREMDDRLHRIVISSAEGLDQTIKMPARTDAYFDRLQEAIDTQATAGAAYPDIVELIRRVHARLDEVPVLLQLPQEDGSQVPYLLQRRDLQQIAAGAIADPGIAASLMRLYAEVDRGETERIVRVLGRRYAPDDTVSLRAMSTVMDVASGIGERRRRDVERQAETSLLNDFLNSTLFLTGVAPELDLGDSFRKPPMSDVPLLLLSGTLDGRTYIGSQREAVSGFTQLSAVTVRNAGHNLFMSSPEVSEVIVRFMRGEPVADRVIVVPLPDFLNP